MALNIIVCTKQVPDPEAPPASFKVDPNTNTMTVASGVAQVVSPFDEQAVEAALRIKDKAEAKVTAISLGPKLQRDVVKKALSMGGDELVLLEDEIFAQVDSWSAAYALASAIKKVGEYDLILCGRQAADWDQGQVGSGIAEILGIPVVTVAKDVEVLDGKVKVTRVTADGYEVVESSLPCLVTVSNELGEPRYPTLMGIRKAGKIQPQVWKAQDIGLSPSEVDVEARKAKLVKLFQPVKEAKCEIIEGENLGEAATNLALKLREVKVI